MLDLEPIKARLAAATPGPWRFDSSWIPSYRRHANWLRSDGVAADGAAANCVLRVVDGSMLDKDADLIENAPADLAALVAEVERLREALKNLVDCWNDYQPSLDFDGRMNDAVNDAALAAQEVLGV